MKANLNISLLLCLFILFSGFDIDKEKGRKNNKKDECKEFAEVFHDKVTGTKKYIAKEKIRLLDFEKKNAFDLIWFKTKDEYTLAIKADRKICFDYDVAVSFHLLEGSVVTTSSSQIANCESLMTIHFSDEQDLEKKIEMLASSEVVGISFDNKRKSYKLKVNQSQAQLFKQTLNCLAGL